MDIRRCCYNIQGDEGTTIEKESDLKNDGHAGHRNLSFLRIIFQPAKRGYSLSVEIWLYGSTGGSCIIVGLGGNGFLKTSLTETTFSGPWKEENGSVVSVFDTLASKGQVSPSDMLEPILVMMSGNAIQELSSNLQ